MYKKIFWGLIIATFHLNISRLSILPAFVGWIIVFGGIKIIEKDLDGSLVKKVKIASLILIILTLILEIVNISGCTVLDYYYVFVFMPVIISFIELLVMHTVLELTINCFVKLNQIHMVDKYTKKDRIYIILKGIELALLLIISLNSEEYIVYIGIALTIGLRIYLLTIINSLSKENYDSLSEI